HADRAPPRQPVDERTHQQGLPREEGGDEGQQGTQVDGADPEERRPGDLVTVGDRGVVGRRRGGRHAEGNLPGFRGSGMRGTVSQPGPCPIRDRSRSGPRQENVTWPEAVPGRVTFGPTSRPRGRLTPGFSLAGFSVCTRRGGSAGSVAGLGVGEGNKTG